MARPKINISAKRAALIDAATRVFLEKGYKLSQMGDVAAEMGVSSGSLYNYVSSKDQLFGWVLGNAFELEIEDEAGLGALEIVDLLKVQFDQANWTPVLDVALLQTVIDDFDTELTGVIGEYYDFLIRFRVGIQVIEKSVHNFPELSRRYFDDMRLAMILKLQTYLANRKELGLLPDVGDIAIATRSVVELLAFWTLHQAQDISHSVYDSQNVRGETIRFIVRSLNWKG
jgi:AcrR family transcriptional regulator